MAILSSALVLMGTIACLVFADGDETTTTTTTTTTKPVVKATPRPTDLINQYERDCLMSAAEGQLFVFVIDFAKDPASNSFDAKLFNVTTAAWFDNIASFAEMMGAFINPNNYFVVIMDGLTAYYISGAPPPTTTTSTTTTTTTTSSPAASNNGTADNNKATTTSIKPFNERPKPVPLPSIKNLTITALNKQLNGQPASSDTVAKPFKYALVITDGSQRTSAAAYPNATAMLIADVGGRWSVTAGSDFKKGFVFVADNINAARAVRRSARLGYCNQVHVFSQ